MIHLIFSALLWWIETTNRKHYLNCHFCSLKHAINLFKKKNHTDPKLLNGSVCPTVHPLISALHVFVLWLDSSSQKPLISSNSCAKQSLLLIGWFWLMMFPPPHPCLWWCHLKAWPPLLNAASASASRLTAACWMKENASRRMKISYGSNKYLQAV